MDPQSLTEQSVILGTRLLQERELSEKTIARAAAQLGVTSNTIKSFENGKTAPGLPQLELLALLYRTPLPKLLWGVDESAPEVKLDQEKAPAFVALRTRIIAATIKQARLHQKLSLKKAAERVGITVGAIKKYESATLPIPEPILENLCLSLGIKIESLVSQLTPKTESATGAAFNEPNPSLLPPEIGEFVSNPANLPYLELAKKLSTLDAAKLRTIAEDLLEITL
jgi:transcriptional regulator with XRE-family HTH domain